MKKKLRFYGLVYRGNGNCVAIHENYSYAKAYVHFIELGYDVGSSDNKLYKIIELKPDISKLETKNQGLLIINFIKFVIQMLTLITVIQIYLHTR